MAFCPTCGAQVEGKFCAKCGSAVSAGPAAPPPPPPSGGYNPNPGGYAQNPGGYGTAAGTAPAAAAGGMSDNVAGALCYVLGILTGILFLVLAPYNQNKTVRFHAFQSIFFNVGMIVCYIGLTIVGIILGHIPLLGFLAAILGFVLWLVVFFGSMILWLVLMWKAYNNQKFVLPIIGPLAEKQA